MGFGPNTTNEHLFEIVRRYSTTEPLVGSEFHPHVTDSVGGHWRTKEFKYQALEMCLGKWWPTAFRFFRHTRTLIARLGFLGFLARGCLALVRAGFGGDVDDCKAVDALR